MFLRDVVFVNSINEDFAFVVHENDGADHCFPSSSLNQSIFGSFKPVPSSNEINNRAAWLNWRFQSSSEFQLAMRTIPIQKSPVIFKLRTQTNGLRNPLMSRFLPLLHSWKEHRLDHPWKRPTPLRNIFSKNSEPISLWLFGRRGKSPTVQLGQEEWKGTGKNSQRAGIRVYTVLGLLQKKPERRKNPPKGSRRLFRKKPRREKEKSKGKPLRLFEDYAEHDGRWKPGD